MWYKNVIIFVYQIFLMISDLVNYIEAKINHKVKKNIIYKWKWNIFM